MRERNHFGACCCTRGVKHQRNVILFGEPAADQGRSGLTCKREESGRLAARQQLENRDPECVRDRSDCRRVIMLDDQGAGLQVFQIEAEFVRSIVGIEGSAGRTRCGSQKRALRRFEYKHLS